MTPLPNHTRYFHTWNRMLGKSLPQARYCPTGKKGTSFPPQGPSSKKRIFSYPSGFYRVEGLYAAAAAPPPPFTAPQDSVALSCDRWQGTRSVPQHWGLESAHSLAEAEFPTAALYQGQDFLTSYWAWGTCAHIFILSQSSFLSVQPQGLYVP